MSKNNITHLARHKNRPTGVDFISNIFTSFLELHGDRCFGDDKAIITGVAKLFDISVTVIAQERGKDTKDKIKRNFGMAHPEGYRKALRQMKLAEKFKRPIVCFIDTSGAYCGIAAEERGQGFSIAQNLTEMSTLKVPVIAVLIGEGGSGGALALAVADRVFAMQNAIYSVISPEGCASILWKDNSKVNEAIESLKITTTHLSNFGVVEKVIEETDGFDFTKQYVEIKQLLYKEFKVLKNMNVDNLLDERYKRFRKF